MELGCEHLYTAYQQIRRYHCQATQILREHADDREWSKSDIASAVEQHALYTWGASTPMNKAAINIVRGEGVCKALTLDCRSHDSQGQHWSGADGNPGIYRFTSTTRTTESTSILTPRYARASTG